MSDFQSEGAGSNPSQPHQITLKLVESDFDKKTFGNVVENFHSYVPSRHRVGRRLDYLIYADNTLVGVLGWGNHEIPESKAITNFIGWTKEQRIKHFNQVVNNKKACFLPQAPHNLGSKALSLAEPIVKHDWRAKYGDKPLLLITLVGASQKGTIYQAANWIYVGETAGNANIGKAFVISKRPDFASPNRPRSMNQSTKQGEPKKIFAKPLHRYWKRELCTP